MRGRHEGGVARIRIALAIASGALLVAPAEADDENTRATMNEIFEAVRFLLPLSLSDEAFGDPSQRDTILNALTTLAKDGASLKSHGRTREASFTFLSASLARDTADARAGLVDYIAASSLLHRYRVEAPRSKSEQAEAYYLLGGAESRVGRTFWLSQTEFYLDTSIRLDPGGARAEAAFDLLEEFVISGYTGSAGSDVPTDVRERLLELRQRIDAS